MSDDNENSATDTSLIPDPRPRDWLGRFVSTSPKEPPPPKSKGGVKGKSGPPGNLNGCKNPWETFWRRRALRPADRWIVPVIFDYAEQLLADRRGPQEATAGERRAIEIATTARGCSMLILAEARSRGFVVALDGTWDLAPGAKELARFLGLEVKALKALGLDRRAAPIMSIEQYVAQFDEAKAKAQSGAQNAPDAPAATDPGIPGEATE